MLRRDLGRVGPHRGDRVRQPVDDLKVQVAAPHGGVVPGTQERVAAVTPPEDVVGLAPNGGRL